MLTYKAEQAFKDADARYMNEQLATVTKERDELADICTRIIERGIGSSDLVLMKRALAKINTDKTGEDS